MGKFLSANVLKFKPKIAEESQEIIGEVRDEDFLYIEVNALQCDRPNQNGDNFQYSEMIKVNDDGVPIFRTFVGAGLFVNHMSADVNSNIGIICDAEMIKDDRGNHICRLICGVDRKKAPDIVRGLEIGRLNAVSMGCGCGYSLCSVCGKEIRGEQDYCDHLKYSKGKKINGIIACENLRDFSFHELSIVTSPADPVARLINILAEDNMNGKMKKVASVESFNIMEKIGNKLYKATMDEKLKILNELKGY